MQLFKSSSQLHKYYPDLQISKDEALLQSQSDLFSPNIFINHLAEEILRSHDLKSTTNRITSPFRIAIRCIESFTKNAAKLATAAKAQGQGRHRRRGISGSEEPVVGKNFWKEMPKFLLAGAVSTVVSRTCIAPLERIKLECIVQGQKHTWTDIVRWIWLSEGLKGFWKGNMLNLFRMVPFKTINFICYDMYLDSLCSIAKREEITNQDRLVGGGISGVTATVICLPLDTVQSDPNEADSTWGEMLGGVAGCFFHMIHNEGFLSLYKGLSAALISMVPANAVFYAVYDILKSSYLSRRQIIDSNDIGVLRTLLYGAIAGVCAETVTYPLEVVRRQLQLQQSAKLSLATAFVRMIERDGFGSLFTGLVPSTLQVLPSAALSYLFYELMKSVLKIS